MFTSGYTATFNFANAITVGGTGACNLTLGANMGFAGGGTIGIASGPTMTANGRTCPQPISIGGGVAVVLVGDWINSSLVTITSTYVNKTTTEKLYCAGGLTANATGGTAILVVTGGSISTPSQVVALSAGKIQVAGGSGTVNFATSIKMNGSSTLSYVSGVVTYCGGFTLSFGGAATVDNWSAYPMPNVIAVNTLTFSGAPFTIVNLVLPPSGTATYAGAFGWIAANVICLATGAHVLTLKKGVEYVCTLSFGMGGTSSTVATIASSDATLLAKLTLRSGCAYDLSWAVLTRLDASSGMTLYSYHGTLNSTLNSVGTGMPLVFQLLQHPVDVE